MITWLTEAQKMKTIIILAICCLTGYFIYSQVLTPAKTMSEQKNYKKANNLSWIKITYYCTIQTLYQYLQ